MTEDSNRLVLNLTPGTELANEVEQTCGADLIDTIQVFIESIAKIRCEDGNDIAARYDDIQMKALYAAMGAIDEETDDYPSQIVVVAMTAYSMLGIIQYIIDRFKLEMDIFETENGGA